MAIGMELDNGLEEYLEEITVATMATVLNQPPSVIRKETFRDMEAVLLVKQIESKRMEQESSMGEKHGIQWQKTS